MRLYATTIWHFCLVQSSLSFFFPSSSCSCSCPTVPPPCPSPPACAAPAPCTSPPVFPIASGIPVPVEPVVQQYQAVPQYQQAWTVAAPLPPPPPPPSSYYPSQTVEVLRSTDSCTECSKATLLPAPMTIQSRIYQPPPPPPPPIPTFSPIVLPMPETTNRVVEVVASPMPTLIPPLEQSSVYDDTAPALPPPAPIAPSYRTSETIVPAVDYRPTSSYVGVPDKSAVIDAKQRDDSLNSGETGLWPGRVSTEGVLQPIANFDRRNQILKRMRNARTLGAVIPHTNSTCNSNMLANVMARAIADDVSVSKRMVLRATELAFNGAKFDVFCANGEFSYSIHSRKYCEVTREDITCFAFR